MTFFTPRPEVSPDEMRLLPEAARDDAPATAPAPPDRESPPITIRAEDLVYKFEECQKGRHARCCGGAFTQRMSQDGSAFTVRNETCDCRCHPVRSAPRT